jgi:hypothetical protein
MANTEKVQAKGDALIPVVWKYAQGMAKQTGKPAVDFYKLLMETANQETHFGSLNDTGNVMNVLPDSAKELSKPQYSKYTKGLGVTNFDVNGNIDSSVALAATLYLSRLKDHDLSTPQSRAQAWKELYNTKAGKGTPEKYLGTNSMMDWAKTDEWWKGMQDATNTKPI